MTVEPAVTARSDRRFRCTWAVSLALLFAMLTGCAGIEPDPSGSAASSDADSASGTRRDQARTADELRAEFAEFASKLPGEVAVAWAAVGSRQGTQSLGSVQDEDAWSTAKVPLAVARLRLAGGKFDERTTEVLRRAITNSDNEAAEVLWRGLGSPTKAVAILQRVLRDAGDEGTKFSSQAFGRSLWTTRDQAQFAAGLPCLPHGPTVLDLMDEITVEHRWGLANAALPAQYKGGWGIGKHGLLVRQFGVVRTPDQRQVGISIATMPHTTDLTVATSNLDAVARWMAARLGPADGGACA